MCCFSRPVERVSSTRIFARPLDDVRQRLVYGMTLDVSEDVAMILPIPVPPGSPDDAVRFVDLSACPTFFDALSAMFPAPPPAGGFGPLARGPAPQSAPLVVHDVGDFEASFVPRRRDFDRLDPRFRLPGDVWESLPRYYDWGFCVFKLRSPKPTSSGLFRRFMGGGKGPRVSKKVHPMAFDFPRRDGASLFFPTVHVHDGVVHPTADFDHELFCQTAPEWEPLMDWERSAHRAERLGSGASEWSEASGWLYKRTMKGDLPNRDTYLALPKLRARTAVADRFRVRMKAAWEHLIDDGKTELEPRVKKWMRVSEAERVRIREAVTALLAKTLEDNAEAWSVGPFRHDEPFETFYASNERLEPQEVNVAFRGVLSLDTRAAVQRAVQEAFDRASVEHRITIAPPS